MPLTGIVNVNADHNDVGNNFFFTQAVTSTSILTSFVVQFKGPASVQNIPLQILDKICARNSNDISS